MQVLKLKQIFILHHLKIFLCQLQFQQTVISQTDITKKKDVRNIYTTKIIEICIKHNNDYYTYV